MICPNIASIRIPDCVLMRKHKEVDEAVELIDCSIFFLPYAFSLADVKFTFYGPNLLHL